MNEYKHRKKMDKLDGKVDFRSLSPKDGYIFWYRQYRSCSKRTRKVNKTSPPPGFVQAERTIFLPGSKMPSLQLTSIALKGKVNQLSPDLLREWINGLSGWMYGFRFEEADVVRRSGLVGIALSPGDRPQDEYANSRCRKESPTARFLAEFIPGVDHTTETSVEIDVLEYNDSIVVQLPRWLQLFSINVNANEGLPTEECCRVVPKEAAIAALDKALEQTQWRNPNEQQRNDRAKRECNNFQGYSGE